MAVTMNPRSTQQSTVCPGGRTAAALMRCGQGRIGPVGDDSVVHQAAGQVRPHASPARVAAGEANCSRSTWISGGVSEQVSACGYAHW